MRKITFLAAAVGSALASSAFAQVASNTLPSGGNVAAGSATISTPSTGTMQIDQTTQRAIIDWQSFSIGSAAWVRFVQPGASSVVLNRVVGASPSEIFGRLTANGQVFLANPNGVLFAPGASVDVGSLFATSLSISDADFLASRYVFSNPGNAGTVVNQGTIVTANGYTALAGPRVRNDGVIVARMGSAALAAGDRVSLDMIGDGLINISVDQAALNASVVNTGRIEADGGRVILTARSANALLDTVINSSGVLRANRLEERNGEIILDGGNNGGIEISGTFETTAGSITGGTINANVGDLDQTPAPIITGPTEIAVGPATLPLSTGNVAASSSGSLTTGTITQPHPASLTSSGSLAVSTFGSTNLQVGGSNIAEISQAIKPMPQAEGSVSTKSGSVAIVNGAGIGTLAPMKHSIEGTGVAVPSSVMLLPQ